MTSEPAISAQGAGASPMTEQSNVTEAMRETARLQRELDITNADHIALWIEHNTLLDEPMNQCTSWLACRIVEAHEAAMTTAAPQKEIVGLLVEALEKIEGGHIRQGSTIAVEGRWQDGFTALQQIARTALEAARKQG
jgi:hypothetical protein